MKKAKPPKKPSPIEDLPPTPRHEQDDGTHEVPETPDPAPVKKIGHHVEIPVPHDWPSPDTLSAVPVPVDPAKIEHLPVPVELTHCEVTLVNPMFGDLYLWLKIPKGFELPPELKPGQTIKADVQFSPPHKN